MSDNSEISCGRRSEHHASRRPRRCGAHLSVEDGLHFNLPREVELLRCRFGAFVPLLEDFAEPGRIDFDELLQTGPPCVHQLGGEEDIIYLQLSQVPFEEAEPFFDRTPLNVVGDVRG